MDVCVVARVDRCGEADVGQLEGGQLRLTQVAGRQRVVFVWDCLVDDGCVAEARNLHEAEPHPAVVELLPPAFDEGREIAWAQPDERQAARA